ncbi:MAG TPA: LptA/OstA family protein [Terracidiphilus sp.]|nr:LptA/OstA family protein [Terracidiphilus sp.]
MRLTIERLRTMVLAAGILLVGALVVFLAIGKGRNPLSTKDLPQKLGVNIQQDFSGVTYTQARGGHTLFRIHASKVVQLKAGNALLHDVEIELYGEDGTRVDRIAGNEFEYDNHAGIARANGPVEITLMRPGMAPAIAPRAKTGAAKSADGKTATLSAAAQRAAQESIHVETSGLVFDRDSGVARTDKRVEFRMAQASGSAVGAVFDSDNGQMTLGGDVVLNTERGGTPVRLTARHAEFDRDAKVCRLRGADALLKGGEIRTEEATIDFRPDGSAEKLRAANGIVLTTGTGGRLAAPRGVLDFGAHNQPRTGHLEGGVTFASNAHGRTVQGSSPVMNLGFGADGVLRSAHMEQGVRIESEEQSQTRKGWVRTRRKWTSPAADIAFRAAGSGQVQLASIHGTGGVTMKGESRSQAGASMPSMMKADEVTASFGRDSALTGVDGIGHAEIDETAANGTLQTTHGDRLTAEFVTAKNAGTHARRGGPAQIETATVVGHVMLAEQPAAKPGATRQAPMQATADRAVYEGSGEWLHLYGKPRVTDGALQLSAARMDVSQTTGEALAEGNVKATWLGGAGNGNAAEGLNLGGEGPTHVVATQAELNHKTDEAIFRGKARLWQDANSISAPVIVLDRKGQSLRASGVGKKQPVQVVLVGVAAPAMQPGGQAKQAAATQVIQIRGGELQYSARTRKVVMVGGKAGPVVAESAEGTTKAAKVELDLLPPGKGARASGVAAQVERMTAIGNVTISAQGREGKGGKLVYTGSSGEYELTGNAGAPPRLVDPVHGSVTGEALIFNSRDDSVRIEGGGHKTTTRTTAPRRPGKRG